jgi:hypothetical protein
VPHEDSGLFPAQLTFGALLNLPAVVIATKFDPEQFCRILSSVLLVVLSFPSSSPVATVPRELLASEAMHVLASRHCYMAIIITNLKKLFSIGAEEIL